MVSISIHTDSEETKYGVRTETGITEQMVWNISGLYLWR